MNLNRFSRRTFIASSAATVVVAAAAPAAPVWAATLHGDGRHDDTNALQALFDGQPVGVAKPNLVAVNTNGRIRLLNGKFRTSRKIRIGAGSDLYCANCAFRIGDGSTAPYPLLQKTR